MSQQPTPATHTAPMASPATTQTIPGAQVTSTRGLGGVMNQPNNGSGGGGGKMLFVALGLAVAAVVLMNIYIELVKHQNKIDSFTVYRLRFSVEPGDRLDEKSFEAVQVPDTQAFRGGMDLFVKQDRGTKLPDKAGEVFTRHGASGEFLTYRMFSPIDERESERLVTPGKVVRGVRVSRENLVTVLRPGAEVNLQGVFRINGQQRSIYVMTGVTVAAINGLTWLDEEDAAPGKEQRVGTYTSLDLELTNEENLALMMLSRIVENGAFEVSLRNPSDTQQFTGVNQELLDLIGQSTSTRSLR